MNLKVYPYQTAHICSSHHFAPAIIHHSLKLKIGNTHLRDLVIQTKGRIPAVI